MLRSHAVRRVSFVFASLFSLLLGLGADAAAAEPVAELTGKAGGLTADEVARRATSTSPLAEEKKHDLAAAVAQRDKALADFFPRVALSASYYRLSPITNPSLGNLVVAPGASEGPIPAGSPLVAAPITIQALENSTSTNATLTVPLSDYVFRLVQANDGAKAQVRASEQTVRAQERKTAYEGRALYYQWVRAELESAVAVENLGLSREHLARMKALAAAESASPADVARVEASVASAELVVTQQRNVALLARERLAIVMHDATSAGWQIGEDLRGAPPPPRVSTGDLEALVRTAQQRRPELVAAGASVLAYEKQIEVARAAALPRLDAIGVATAANPNPRRLPQTQDFHSSWQLGVQLTYSPNDTATGLSQTAAARARAGAAEARRRQLLDAVRSEVTEAVIAHRDAMAAIDTSARRLAAAETSYRARREQFMNDKATTVELTEAQTELFRARLDVVQSGVAVRVANARLAYATSVQ